MNAPVFVIHALRDDLYAAFADRPLPLGSEDQHVLAEFRARLSAVVVPVRAEKREEVLNAKEEVSTIIDALVAGTLRTRLRTSLPYPLTKQPLELRLVWAGINVTELMSSSFAGPPGLLTQTTPPNALRPLNTTRWQYGRTEVQFEFASLVDPSLQVPSLQMPAIDVPVDAWPNGLRAAYELIYFSCWALRGRPEYIGVWVPAPGDVGDIESTIVIPGRSDLSFIRRGHPSIPFELFTPSTKTAQIDLGSAVLMDWHQRCRVLAEQYAMFGEVREAIFWLNVGVESLLRTRMETHILAKGVEIDLDVLDGGKTYWDEAKQLVAAQFPELAEEIVWPAGAKKPSLFQQLKYFCANVPGAPAFELSKTHYSKVSRHRNALFHGSSEVATAISEVRLAMASFDWIAANFCSQQTSSEQSGKGDPD